jgi:hypothetical protein
VAGSPGAIIRTSNDDLSSISGARGYEPPPHRSQRGNARIKSLNI